jgi:hypothetical protein
LVEIAPRGSYSAEIAELFPKIIKMLSKNDKSPTSTDCVPPSLTLLGKESALRPWNIGHGSAAYFPVSGDSSGVSPQILPADS